LGFNKPKTIEDLFHPIFQELDLAHEAIADLETEADTEIDQLAMGQ
jgi:hypothetical protein